MNVDILSADLEVGNVVQGWKPSIMEKYVLGNNIFFGKICILRTLWMCCTSFTWTTFIGKHDSINNFDDNNCSMLIKLIFFYENMLILKTLFSSLCGGRLCLGGTRHEIKEQCVWMVRSTKWDLGLQYPWMMRVSLELLHWRLCWRFDLHN